eukprot:Plantae.Rhodophyta-Hildenbrandia_rubra.ctg3013.p1 GENE.Plantae.Rhodophyta-Hildenbrandia_rubra.ctg3013~~Plantae.Rhodophyta-Hildenbrandia_rubra.ctg3013.p1  ORF type:complete len:470 (+),score=68.60 Plantae.Rhodophyta-Hildenbrandia_rubra.ctg3013:3452-4861(+)
MASKKAAVDPTKGTGAVRKESAQPSRALSIPLVIFCVIVTAAAILIAQQRDVHKVLGSYVRRFAGLQKTSVLRLLAEGEMDWERSTTPIPISSVSYVVKCMLGGKWNEVPEPLHWMKGKDTILVKNVRKYFFKERLVRLKQTCAKETQFCDWHERDSTYGLTPLHLAMYGGDDELVDYLTRDLGIKDTVKDRYGRLAKNVSFASFMSNSKRFAKLRGSDCQIPEVLIDGSQRAWDEVNRLVGEGEPVMMRNAGSSLDNKFMGAWNVDDFVKEFGGVKVRVGSVPYSKVFGIKEDEMKLAEFWERYGGHDDGAKEPLYVFQQDMGVCEKGWQLLKDLVRRSFPTPELIEDPDAAGKDSIQFFFGMTGSGAPLHVHADAVNMVVSGEKRWYIQTPQKTMYSRKPVKEWVEQDVPTYDETEKPLECTQHAGDIVYVPMDWGHAILNTKDNTFGYAIEVLNKRDTFSHLAPRP